MDYGGPYLFSVYFDVSHVVFEYGWDVDFGELVFAEDDQEASLSASTVTYNHKLFPYGRHSCVQSPFLSPQ